MSDENIWAAEVADPAPWVWPSGVCSMFPSGLGVDGVFRHLEYAPRPEFGTPTTVTGEDKDND